MTANLKIKDIVYIAIMIVLIVVSTLVGIYFLFISDLEKFWNDLKRVKHINEINRSISSFYSDKNKLPESLSQIRDYSIQEPNKDPISYKPIEYKPMSEKNYKICMDFEVGSDRILDYKNTLFKDNNDFTDIQQTFEYYRSNDDSKFQFNKGYQCLEFTVKEVDNLKNTPTPYVD